MSSFFEELKRRNVIRVAVFYVVASWLVLQVAELLFEVLDLPGPWLRLVLALLILGMPLVLVLSWVFELTPEGVKREKDVDRSQSITHRTGKRMNTVIVVLLVLTIGAVGLDRLIPESVTPGEAVADAEQAPPENTTATQSIAVLPFVDLSPAGDQEYFSDGIAEEILNVLVRIEGLKVASRTTSWGFKGQEALGIPYMAQQMKVRHILEGSVRKSGNTIRITAQLIDADTDQHLWSETFDRQLTTESIFAIQDEIAGAIGRQLGIIIDPADVASAVRTDTSDLDAYELFLEAQQLFVERQELDRAIRLFEQAVAIDPGFARAWAGMAAAGSVAPSWNYRDRDYLELAANAANKAISLNPDVALAYAVLGNLVRETSGRPDFEKGFDYFDRALARDPREATTLLWRGIQNLDLGYFDRAEQDFLRCLEIDPGYENCRAHQALAALYAGEIDRGMALNAQSLRNGFTGNFYPFMFAYAALGQEIVAATALANWNDANNLTAATKFEYRALVDPAFEFEADRLQIEAIYRASNKPWLGWSTSNDDFHFWFREYHKVNSAYYSYWWFPHPEEFRNSPHRERLIREMGLPQYWRKHGFPPICRAIGDNDFECD